MIIGVSGGSGAGKSTTSRKLAELLPNSLLIVADIFMHKVSIDKEDEIMQKIGIKKEPDIFFYNYLHDSFEKITSWISIIRDDVELNIEKIINENPDKEYIIIDWCYIPLSNYNEKCDFKICVKSDFECRKNRLTTRLINMNNSKYDKYNIPFSKWTPDAYDKRIKYTDLSVQGYNFDYYLYNTSSIEELNDKISSLAQKIIEINNNN